MTDGRIAVVLDASAVRRFQVARDLAVGELIGEVADEKAFVAVPVTAVADARGHTHDPRELAMLEVLITSDNVVVWSMESDEGLDVGAAIARMPDPRLVLAHAAYLADQEHAQLVTERGDEVRRAFGDLHGIVDI